MDIETAKMNQDYRKGRNDKMYDSNLKWLEGEFTFAYNEVSIEGESLSAKCKNVEKISLEPSKWKN